MKTLRLSLGLGLLLLNFGLASKSLAASLSCTTIGFCGFTPSHSIFDSVCRVCREVQKCSDGLTRYYNTPCPPPANTTGCDTALPGDPITNVGALAKCPSFTPVPRPTTNPGGGGGGIIIRPSTGPQETMPIQPIDPGSLRPNVDPSRVPPGTILN